MKMPAVLLLGLVAVVRHAEAVPIQAYGGWLDGTFRVYDLGHQVIDGQTFGAPNVLRREFVLGTDWFPAVPVNFTQNGLAYEACLSNTNPLVPNCFANVLPRTVDWNIGHEFPPAGVLGEPAAQTSALTDGCSPLSNPFSNDPVLMVARGNCAFADKWAYAENGGWGGLLIVEAPGSPVAASAILPGTPNFTTPMTRITADVAAEIRRGSTSADTPGVLSFPWIELRVTWSLTPPPPPPPPPEPVPEPSTLALLAAGAGLLAARKRR
jgi:hypothetical protein